MRLYVKSRYMVLFFLWVILFFIVAVITGSQDNRSSAPEMELLNVQTIPTGSGVKAVVISPDGSKVYSINLEGMSLYEFDRGSRRIMRKVQFVPHPGKGYNYDKKVWINSYQEKPVEACITHNGRFLWTSLHNAGGVVVWDLENNDTGVEGKPYKEAWLHERSSQNRESDFSKRKIQ